MENEKNPFLGILMLVPLLLISCVNFNNYTDPEKMIEEMVVNYEEHKADIEELYEFCENAIDDNSFIEMEFTNNTLFHREKLCMMRVQPAGGNLTYPSYNKKARMRMDSLMTMVGMTNESFESIKDGLKIINCTGINIWKSEESMLLMYYRDGPTLYSYKIYKKPFSDEDKKFFIEDKRYLPYNDHVVFVKYIVGVGPVTFYDGVKEKFLEQHQPW